MEHLLAQHLVPEGCGANFCLTRDGGLVLIEPLTPDAVEWLNATITSEAVRFDRTLVVEMRYATALIDAMIDAGFKFESDGAVH